MIVQGTGLKFYCRSPFRSSPPLIAACHSSLSFEYKKRSKSSQNLPRTNIYIHLFRRLPELSETQIFLSLWNCIDPYFRVSEKAAAFSVISSYHSQSRMSLATTCQCIYAVVPKYFHKKTRTGRSAASFACTSANITLAQPALPAIDSKTFTDYGPLLSPSLVRTVPLSPDSVKRWAHFHWDGSLGAWSCLCDIIAQMFDKVNSTPFPKWVWEINCKIFFQFSRYIRF